MPANRFSEKALDEAYGIAYKKFDLSARPVVNGYTIDSFTSKDLDDGIFLTRKGDNLLLQVSIADVAEYITPDTELFAEALRRVATVYRAEFNIPMLPKALSESKLSLWPGHLKPTITFDIEIKPYGEIADFQIRETAFNNLKKLSYEEFDKIIKQGNNTEESILFNEMATLAYSLLDNRRAKGALAIYDIKKGIYTNEEGTILPLTKGMSNVGNIVVQEFMILTNTSLAWFNAKNDLPLLYRNHVPKQSAPNRNEILEQINIAILNLKYLDSLRNRGSLWFNRAVYEPTIKGHFGLNESVYTHVTSPIRRIADLINHLLIKAYIHSTKPAFNFLQLVEMSNNINEVIRQSNEERVNLFKDQAKKYSINKLELTSEIELFNMEASKFSQILKAGATTDNLTSQLEAALNLRFEADTIDINMFYLILFKTFKDSEEWLEMKKTALSYLYNYKGFPNQLLNILVQKEIVESFEFDVKQENGKFYANTIGVVDKVQIETPQSSKASSKKDAIHYSAFNFIQILLGIQIKPLVAQNDQIDEAETDNEATQPKEPDDNYVSKLYDMYMRHKNDGFEEPLYTFEMSGPSHSPIIKCLGTLTGAKFVYTEEATANSKKLAKNLVSEKLWRKYYAQNALAKEQKQLAQENREDEAAKTEENANYISIVQELLQKNKLQLPSYQFRRIGEDHNPTFECYLTYSFNDKSQEINAFGSNKMEAKQNAAQMLLLHLKVNHGLS